MKQQTMVAMMTTKRRMEEAMPAKVVGLRGRKEKTKHYAACRDSPSADASNDEEKFSTR